jgi:hypothetical protein
MSESMPVEELINDLVARALRIVNQQGISLQNKWYTNTNKFMILRFPDGYWRLEGGRSSLLVTRHTPRGASSVLSTDHGDPPRYEARECYKLYDAIRRHMVLEDLANV